MQAVPCLPPGGDCPRLGWAGPASWRRLGLLCSAALWDCMSSLRHTNALGSLHHAQTSCFCFCLIKSSQRHVVLLEGRIPMFLRVRNAVYMKLGALYQERLFCGGARLLTAKWKLHHSLQCLFLACSNTLHFSPALCCTLSPVVCLLDPSLLQGTTVPAQHGPYKRWGAGALWLMQDHGPHVKDKHNPFYTTVKSWPTLTLYTCSMQ